MGKLFDTMNAIFYKKKGFQYDKKDTNAYGLSLWLSHDRDLCSTVNSINPYLFNTNDDLIYKYYFLKVPKGKRYIKWIKKEDVEKLKGLKEQAELLDCSVEELKKSLIKE